MFSRLFTFHHHLYILSIVIPYVIKALATLAEIAENIDVKMSFTVVWPHNIVRIATIPNALP